VKVAEISLGGLQVVNCQPASGAGDNMGVLGLFNHEIPRLNAIKEVIEIS
jgi:hypothetical protein